MLSFRHFFVLFRSVLSDCHFSVSAFKGSWKKEKLSVIYFVKIYKMYCSWWMCEFINPATSTKQPLFNKWKKKKYFCYHAEGDFGQISDKQREPPLAGTWLTGCRTGSSDSACCSFTQHTAADVVCTYVWDRHRLCVCICECVRIGNSWPTAFLNHHQIK